MFTKLHSLGVFGLEGFVVDCEVDISGGLPQFAIVGLPDNAVKEAADRVRSALKNLHFEYPVSRVTVNLAPADVRKTGPVYDLPLLLGLLAAGGQMPALPQDCAFIGELSLDAEVRAVQGVLPMAMACAEAGIAKLFVPAQNAAEAAAVPGIEVYAVHTARQVIDHFRGEGEPLPATAPTQLQLVAGDESAPDFSQVHGQPLARRAMEVAAAGGHNILLVGPPGAGKSMLAKRLPGILPPLTHEEAIQTSKIYSVGGVRAGGPLVLSRPFRAPHHSTSAAGLAGGGSLPRPGEISLAHNGVLFLDELPEFRRDALEILRQPMEDGTVSVRRVGFNITYPSRFMLVAAMNPCPCGFYGHPTKECRCGPSAIDRYLHKVSGPLLDRIDLHVEVHPVEYEDISAPAGGESSAEMLARVLAARRFAKGRGQAVSNAVLEGDALREACRMTPAATATLKNAFERLGLSARGYDKVLRVSRTLADMEGAEVIDTSHVAEAVQYRSMDRQYGYSV